MKIINWNISYFKANDIKFRYVLSLVENEEFVVVLQEVTQKAYQELDIIFNGYPKQYSLDYRPLGKYDTKSRGLGIAVLTSKNVKIRSANVLQRTLLPERTLVGEVVFCYFYREFFNLAGPHRHDATAKRRKRKPADAVEQRAEA